MSCPECGGHDLWDDDLNPFWGCLSEKCGFMSNTRRNYSHPLDTLNGEFYFLKKDQLELAQQKAAETGMVWKELSVPQKRKLVSEVLKP